MVLAIFIAAIISQLNLDFFEYYLYDLRFRLRPSPNPSGKIEIILLNPATIESLHGDPNAQTHLNLVKKLSQAGAAAIVYSIPLDEIKGSKASLNELSQFLESNETFIYQTNKLEMKGEDNQIRLPKPFDKVRVVSGPRTSDTEIFAKDGVSRRVLLSYQNQELLHPQLAKIFHPHNGKYRGQFSFLDTEQIYIDFLPKGKITTHSFHDILNSKDVSHFKGKVVFVGLDTGRTAREYISTPYSRDVVAMTAVEMHANGVDTLIRDAAPVNVPKWVNWMTTSLIAIFTVHVVLSLTPGLGIGLLLFIFFLFTFIAWLMFWLFGVWIEVAHSALAVFICYYFFIPYRLIIENRRSWEYYQKNKILSQVEELKTNFISMMSHDLKTPIARIRGMVEILRREDPHPTSARGEAMTLIEKSSDDLLKLINSILNFSRIESQGVVLQVQSKDPNTLLTEVIHKYDFWLNEKNIMVVTELEPLFSIPLDVDLIRQVFSNLLENAIKYSPENSKILVSSEEINGEVVIQFADQGMGIPGDELANIFMKFFRSKNAKASPIKGSGLGLYLAKYLVELHKGRISVESEVGVGSTFTIVLPT